MYKIMVNGLPGKMAHIVISTALERGLSVVPYSLTGEVVSETSFAVNGQEFTLLKPSVREAQIAQIKAEHGDFIAIDYTHPTAVNGNAKFYVEQKIPFVMGTTGGDRDALMDLVNQAQHPCVIAPNMAKQIVAFQAMMEMWAREFPQTFAGYNLRIVESHQATKADTSGTAKAVSQNLLDLGPQFDAGIEMVRETEAQIAFGVPPEFLDGHAFHTYSLDSADGSVHFELQHNVCGRKIYAEGTLDAALYLQQQLESGKAQQCFTMIDVLRAGAMD